MHAVLCVDLQSIRVVLVLHVLVNASRAVTRFGAGEPGQVDLHRNAVVLERQVRGLLLFVVGVADEHAGQPVEGQLAVGLGINDGLALRSRLEVDMVRLVAAQGPGNIAAQRELLHAVHHRGYRQPFLEPGLEVARFVQLGVEPAFLECGRVGAEFVVLAARADCLVSRLRRQHAGLDRGMAALDTAHVQVTGFATHQRTAREYGLGQRHQAAGCDRAGSVGQTLGRPQALVLALEIPADIGVGFPALELFEGAQVGVAVVQPGDEAQGDFVVVRVVQKRAAVGAVVHRPTGGVQHEAGLVALGVDLPQLLDADAIGLRVLARVKLEFGDQLFAQVAARAFGEYGVFAVQLHTDLEVLARLAVLAQAHVAGGHALDRTVVVVQHLGGRKTGEDLHAQALGLLRQPTRERAQADDVVAMVLQAARQ